MCVDDVLMLCQIKRLFYLLCRYETKLNNFDKLNMSRSFHIKEYFTSAYPSGAPTFNPWFLAEFVLLDL